MEKEVSKDMKFSRRKPIDFILEEICPHCESYIDVSYSDHGHTSENTRYRCQFDITLRGESNCTGLDWSICIFNDNKKTPPARRSN